MATVKRLFAPPMVHPLSQAPTSRRPNEKPEPGTFAITNTCAPPAEPTAATKMHTSFPTADVKCSRADPNVKRRSKHRRTTSAAALVPHRNIDLRKAVATTPTTEGARGSLSNILGDCCSCGLPQVGAARMSARDLCDLWRAPGSTTLL